MKTKVFTIITIVTAIILSIFLGCSIYYRNKILEDQKNEVLEEVEKNDKENNLYIEG